MFGAKVVGADKGGIIEFSLLIDGDNEELRCVDDAQTETSTSFDDVADRAAFDDVAGNASFVVDGTLKLSLPVTAFITLSRNVFILKSNVIMNFYQPM